MFFIHKKKPNLPIFFLIGVLGALLGVIKVNYHEKHPNSAFKKWPLLMDNYPVDSNLASVFHHLDLKGYMFNACKVFFNM